MEKGKYSVDVMAKTVTFGHVTKTADGEIELTTVFDFSNVTPARMLYMAGSSALIKWRAGIGIKDMTTVEAQKSEKVHAIVDCSKTVERVASGAKKEMKALLSDLLKKGKSIEDIKAMLTADDDEQEGAE